VQNEFLFGSEKNLKMLTIYTDGSCKPNPSKGGWAYIALEDNYEVRKSGRLGNTTNNIMELTAVINAVRDFPQYNTYHIFTDSQYVIKCADGTFQRKKNQELWREYDSVTKGKKIVFTWVKGHNGDKYNEMVDVLASSSN